MSHSSDKDSVYPGRNGKTKPESLSLDIVDKLNLCLGVIKRQRAGAIILAHVNIYPLVFLWMERYSVSWISRVDKCSLCTQHASPMINPLNYSVRVQRKKHDISLFFLFFFRSSPTARVRGYDLYGTNWGAKHASKQPDFRMHDASAEYFTAN